jgi:hypothetical protein
MFGFFYIFKMIKNFRSFRVKFPNFKTLRMRFILGTHKHSIPNFQLQFLQVFLSWKRNSFKMRNLLPKHRCHFEESPDQFNRFFLAFSTKFVQVHSLQKKSTKNTIVLRIWKTVELMLSVFWRIFWRRIVHIRILKFSF